MWSARKLPNPSGIPSAAPNFIPLSARASREGNTLPIAFPFQQLSGKYPSPPAVGTTQLLVTCQESPEAGWQSGRHPQLPGAGSATCCGIIRI